MDQGRRGEVAGDPGNCAEAADQLLQLSDEMRGNNHRPGRFDEQEARRLGVASGPDFGVLQRGGSVTAVDGSTVTPQQVLGEARLGRKMGHMTQLKPLTK